MKLKTLLVLSALALMAAAASAASLTVNWTNNAPGVTNVKVQRSTGTGSFADVATLAPTVTSWIDTTVADNTMYSYRVYCVLGTTVSGFSNVATFLPPPSGTTVGPTLIAKINLTWKGQQKTIIAGNVKPSPNGPYQQVPVGSTVYVYQN